jgi:tetratricopeptide (TPR) repeat protein
MASWVVKVRGKLVHHGASAVGLALSLAASLHGSEGAATSARPETPALREELRRGGLPLAQLAAVSDDRLPRVEQGVPPEKSTTTTNPATTNGVSDKLDLTETLSPGFQSKTNVQADWNQFQETLDELRRQIEAGAARNAQTIATGLSVIEPTLIRHQTEGMDMVRKLNQTTRLAVGGLVVVMLVGIFAAVFMLLRGMNRFVEVFAAARQPGTLGVGSAVAALNPGGLHPGASGSVEQATARFLGAIDRLEHRIQGLEQTAQHHLSETERKKPSAKAATTERQAADRSESAQLSPGTALWPGSSAGKLTSHSSVLVGKGATLLHLGQAEQALQCFEEALASDPHHTEAWVKKGLALEQMQRLEEALESYDQALALDSSITAAYLHKGGVCNQLQRHSEALDCYEKALQTERKAHQA